MAEDDRDEQLVDNLASQILINLGLINVAALAASLTKIEVFQVSSTPFAIGILSAIFAQMLWYIWLSLDLVFPAGIFSKNWENYTGYVVSFFAMVISGALSATCIAYGCFKIMNFQDSTAALLSIVLFIVPIFGFLYALFRKALKMREENLVR